MSRIVIQSGDPQRLAALQRTLQGAGLAVLGGTDLGAVLQKAGGAGMALAVVDCAPPDDDGSSVLEHAVTHGPSSVPVVLLATRVPDGMLTSLFGAGVVDILEQPVTAEGLVVRVKAMVAEVARPPHPPASPEALRLRRMVAFVQGTRRSGLIIAQSAQGPAQLAFREGHLMHAQLGAAAGADAARAVVGLQEVQELRFLAGSQAADWGGATPPAAAPPTPATAPANVPAGGGPRVAAGAASPQDLPPTHAQQVMGRSPPALRPAALDALVVDDDPALLDIGCRFLERAGFVVRRAEHGEAALGLAQQRAPQLVVSDIMMPQVDGWSLLRLFRENHHLREVPFIMLSCHDEYMDRLRQVGAGADAYLAKGVRGDQLVRSVQAAVERHREVWLLAGDGVRLEGRLERVGPLNLLRALAFHACTGTLHTRDTWGQLRLGLRGGHLVQASGDLPPLTQGGADAVRTYVTTRGGAFVFEPRDIPPEGPLEPVDAALWAACEAANAQDASVREALMVQGAGLTIQAPLLQLYESVTTGVSPTVLGALAQGKSPAEVMAETGESPLLVEWVVQDMVRKGVAGFAATRN